MNDIHFLFIGPLSEEGICIVYLYYSINYVLLLDR